MNWEEFTLLGRVSEEQCCCKGDAHIMYYGNVPKFRYITDIRSGYGRTNYIWDEMDICIDN